jgi:NTE family protein
MSDTAEPPLARTALVLSGGGARGAYEAGVLAHVFERVLPRLGSDKGFDVVSGTSVGAIHAAYATATAGVDGPDRAKRLVATWESMEIEHVFKLGARDLLGIPLRSLGLVTRRRGETVGGLVDVRPLEQIVERAIPWPAVHENLRDGRAGVLCISCTDVGTGRVTIFMEGGLSDPTPWSNDRDPGSTAILTEISAKHVRASASLPFLFPAVRINDRYYVDGGLRMNTPLSPALRLRANRIFVVALKHSPPAHESVPVFPEEVITQPAFMIGKVLDALTLDQLEYELRRIGLVNAMIERGESAFGAEFLERVNVAVREQRGVGFRRVRTVVIRPSEDIGRIAAVCQRQSRSGELGLVGALVTRLAARGTPRDEADLLSYLYFDRRFTRQLVELGREDARRREDEILALLDPSSEGGQSA